MSKPANPQISSFLDLPAELRNWIYELIFKHADPLYLSVRRRDRRMVLYRRADDRNYRLQRQAYTLKDQVPKVFPRSRRAGVSLARACQPKLQLLRVCRQIHQEAASVFYSNDFCLAAREGTHSASHDSTGYYIDSATNGWLSQIGQHKTLVRRLQISLGSICPRFCNRTDRGSAAPARVQTFRRQDGYLQFGMLLREIWANNLKLEIKFTDEEQTHARVAYTIYRSSGCYQEQDSRAPAQYGCNPERMSQLLQALCNDELGFKKFLRVIGDIGCRMNGLEGVFALWTPQWHRIGHQVHSLNAQDDNPFLAHAKHFYLDQATKKLRFHDKQPTNLLDLPKPVFDIIAGYAELSWTTRIRGGFKSYIKDL
ncbi:hypothetical protein EK21DRAFT_111830 [Setomelanomma holmii]|uniref:DUF7730 domain-containing protein n=1 Tax=Setomelanomma holmii TaxID=210430 RepID=A0A9P4HBU8_9PLEO|nr:hypothetical protein EK21DRAFT_111830 [Setomelanomma holmii]